jgi:hypothetical protein
VANKGDIGLTWGSLYARGNHKAYCGGTQNALSRRQIVAGGLGTLAMPSVSRLAHAQASTVHLGKQFGLPYLPQMVMEKLKLIEKHAAKEGLPALNAQRRPHQEAAGLMKGFVPAAGTCTAG